SPWSIPFEFPFYQWMCALLAWAGIPLDSAGRLLSFAFLVLTVNAAKPLFRNRREWLIFGILLLTSPLYLFWGTAFLMETLALFLSVWFLAIESPWWACVVGTAAALTKITTFFPFFWLALIKDAYALVHHTRNSTGNHRLHVVALELAARATPV